MFVSPVLQSSPSPSPMCQLLPSHPLKFCILFYRTIYLRTNHIIDSYNNNLYHTRLHFSIYLDININNSMSVRNMVANINNNNNRRQASSHAFVNAKRQRQASGGFQTTWLSDPATYPIIVTLGGALTMVTGVIVSCLMYNPDVQINPNTRASIIRPNPN